MAPGKRKNTLAGDCPNPKKIKEDDCTSNWLEALANYVKETGSNVLNLADRGLRKDKIQSVLTILRDLHVTELNLDRNFLNGIGDLAPLLLQTKITKLSVSESEYFSSTEEGRITKKDLLQLFEILQDSKIIDLSVLRSEKFKFNASDARKFISRLKKSKLITLHSNLFSFFPQTRLGSCSQIYLKTSITCLNLSKTNFDSNIYISLFKNLGRSSVTELHLKDTKISLEALEVLSQKLGKTKVEKLNLSFNKFKNDSLTILAKGLVNSKVKDLDLAGNHFSRLGPLLTVLKKTQIITLSLDFNPYLRHEKLIYPDWLSSTSLVSLNLGGFHFIDEVGERLMECLRFSNVTTLHATYNEFGLLTIKKFTENVKDFNLTDLNLFINPLPLEAFFLLGKCLKESKLIRLDVSDIKPPESHLEADHLLSFLKLTEGSSISQVKMSFYNNYPTWSLPLVSEPKLLANTTFTELNFDNNKIGSNASNLVEYLKFSAVTHLNLAQNKINDDAVAALAENLKETRIRRLILDGNLITSEGAEALAVSLKETNLLYLHLNENRIGNIGIESLAENAENTFITELEVSKNPGKNVLLIDKVLWENKITVHRLVEIFKLVTSQTDSRVLICFDQNFEDLDTNVFLEKCMWFYKLVIFNPRAVNVLLEEKCVSLSRDEIFKSVFEDFPQQFGHFIACRIEADVSEHVRILEKAEEMGLTAIVESLLLNRPVYMLDEKQGILHPYVYKLLLKYKQPICNLAVEPQGVMKIIAYFTKNSHIEGAQNVVSLLQNANIF